MKENKMNELDLFRYELIFDGTTGEEFAKSIGMSYPSYKNVVRNGSKVIPKWVLAFLFGRGYSYVGDALIKKDSKTGNGCKSIHGDSSGSRVPHESVIQEVLN